MTKSEKIMIDTALNIAYNAHRGQVDKAGKPYIFHPIWIASKLNDPVEIAVALLHDVLEDTYITLDDLKNRGLPKEVITAVLIVTRIHGETYREFIDRIRDSNNSVARRIKILDLEHNMDLTRIEEPSEKDIQRVWKYKDAQHKLMAREIVKQTFKLMEQEL